MQSHLARWLTRFAGPAVGMAVIMVVGVPTFCFAEAGQGTEAFDALRRGDYATAYHLLQPLAEEGDPVAQDRLGVLYDKGWGVSQDYGQALKWYRRAAEQHYSLAERNLGHMYEEGHGVAQNYGEAVNWYRRAAEQRLIPAYHNLGYMYEQGRGVPQDYAEAVKWYRRAAEQNFPPAEFSLGLMYAEGHGVPRNDREAAKWYGYAAENGDPSAQNNLGLLYATGRGAPQDYVKAYLWLSLAAALSQSGVDRETFTRNRDRVALGMTQEQLAEGQHLASNWRRPATWIGPKAKAPSVSESESNSPSLTPNAPPRESHLIVSGTGFFVTRDGQIVTNAHVVEACDHVQVRTAAGEKNGAQITAMAKVDDLAVLKTGLSVPAAATFRAGTTVNLGDAVIVYGFPLPGFLASSGNVTTGNVTALAGVRDDPRILQISAPIQRGNSGGPVFDVSGNVVGIVVAKLDALGIASATRDIPQNINFAIKASVATNFLEVRSIAYASAQSNRNLSVADIAKRAETVTVRVECLR